MARFAVRRFDRRDWTKQRVMYGIAKHRPLWCMLLFLYASVILSTWIREAPVFAQTSRLRESIDESGTEAERQDKKEERKEERPAPSRSPVMLFVSGWGGWYMGAENIFISGYDFKDHSFWRYWWFGRLRVGLRFNRLEADLQVDLAHYRSLHYETELKRLWMSLQVGLSGYSLLREKIRIRHGLHAGTCFRVSSRCKEVGQPCEKEDRDNTRPENVLFGLEANLLELGFRLYDGLWLEVSPANFAIPKVYSLALGLRWEGRMWWERTDEKDDKRPKTGAKRRSKAVLFFTLLGSWHYPIDALLEESDDEYTIDSRRSWLGHLRVGIRWKLLEGDLQMSVTRYHSKETFRNGEPDEIYDIVRFGLQAGGAIYSFRHSRFRIRHGLHLGVDFYTLNLCRSKDRSACRYKRHDSRREPNLQGHFADFLIRLHDGLWLEISPFNFGFYTLYAISVGLHWEAFGLW